MNQEDIMKLVKANKLMSEVIDKMALVLLQVMTLDEIDRMEVLDKAKEAANIMEEYDERW